MSTMVVKDTNRYRAQANFVLGIPHSYFTLSYCHKLEKHEGRLRGAIKSVIKFLYLHFLNYLKRWIFHNRAGTFGAMVEYGLERKVSEHSSLAVSMTVGVPTGVMLKIK